MTEYKYKHQYVAFPFEYAVTPPQVSHAFPTFFVYVFCMLCFSYLFHDSAFSLAECDMPSTFFFDVLYTDFPPFIVSLCAFISI